MLRGASAGVEAVAVAAAFKDKMEGLVLALEALPADSVEAGAVRRAIASLAGLI